jgi:hypothetical protein
VTECFKFFPFIRHFEEANGAKSYKLSILSREIWNKRSQQNWSVCHVCQLALFVVTNGSVENWILFGVRLGEGNCGSRGREIKDANAKRWVERGIEVLPGHRVHLYLDRVLFGRSYYKVHRKMDYAWNYLRRGHRCFGHDPISAIAIAAESYPGDYNAVQAALFHIELDKLCTANPQFKRILELQAKRDATKRRRKKRGIKAKKKKSADSADYRQIAEFVEKLERNRRFAKLLTS